MAVSDPELTIREFAPGDEVHFQRLNEEWIVRYFTLEPKDVATLAHPRQSILDPGGRIFFAILGDEVVGCCALIVMSPGEFELVKMAVTESAQGRGIGRSLLQGTIAEARASGATRIYLETNRKLATAIRLYGALGFRDVPADRVVPSPYARSDVAMELDLR